MGEVPLYQALRSYEDVTERIEEALLAQVLEAKTRIWRWPCYVCRIRSTAATSYRALLPARGRLVISMLNTLRL